MLPTEHRLDWDGKNGGTEKGHTMWENGAFLIAYFNIILVFKPW